MGSTKALLLAGVMALGVAQVARAADLSPPPPPPMPEYAPPEPVQFGGWYLRGDVGVGIASSPDFRSSLFNTQDDGSLLRLSSADVDTLGIGRDSQSIGDSAILGIGVGYQWNPWLRFDATGEYRTSQALNSIEHYDAGYAFNQGVGYDAVPTGQFAHDEYHGQVQSTVFLVNGYVDLGTWYRMTPYLHGGVGFAYNHLSTMVDRGAGVDVKDFDGNVVSAGYGEGGFGTTRGVEKFDLAWAAGAGVSYDITRNVKLDLSYRYLDMGTIKTGLYECNAGCLRESQRIHLASNDIRLGLRWLITDYAAPPVYVPETPIIRKD